MALLKELQGPLGPAYDGNQPVAGAYADSPLTPGTGISTGTGTVYQSWVTQDGPFIKTTIFIDLTGLASSSAGDIIGKDGGTANCHIGQVTTAVNGVIFKGTMSCAETPVTGEDDIDLFSATESTGAEDAAVSGLTETTILDAGADWTKGVQKNFTGNLAANQYLYLVGSGGGTSGVYTAGQFVIEFWGVRV
jgi:hypothetical protein